MNTTTDVENVLAEAAERIKKDAYAAGWRDAITAVNKALSDVGEIVTVPDKITVISATGTVKSVGRMSGKMPKQGTTPHAILMEVVAHPGMTGGQIVEAVRASGHTAPVPSIQTNIQRLKGKKLIVLRHGKWFPE